MRSGKPHYEDLRAEYAQLWDTADVRPDRLGAVTATARRIVQNKARYEAVSAATGVPWVVIGLIHAMEAGLRFDRHLHNGDPLSARTRNVPAGRPLAGTPPFTWEASAIDALKGDGLDKVKDWPLERVAYELESFNGWGYRLYHHEVNSPYLWSGTTHYTAGKYVADGRWSASAVSQQSGALALLRRVMELDITLELARDNGVEAVPAWPVAEVERKTIAGSKTVWSSAATFFGGGALTLQGVNAAVSETKSSGLLDLSLALAAQPTFWISAGICCLAVFIFGERLKKIMHLGV